MDCERGAHAESICRLQTEHALRRKLWRIVEDPKSKATERAGAALALRSTLGEEGKTRIRVTANACASPKLRVALERVLETDEASLAAALEPLEEPRLRGLRADNSHRNRH